MKKVIFSGSLVLLLLCGLAMAGQETLITSFQQFNDVFTGEWQQYGKLFTELQQTLFPRLFLLVLTIVPLLFFLHLVAIGSKDFPPGGRQIFCYSILVRIVHWIAAIAFSILLVSGIPLIFGLFAGSGSLGILARNIHLVATLVFSGSILFMLPLWIQDMLPAPYDIKWLFVMGGYLNQESKPVPAGKFNAGQKMWFWLATLGGGAMAFSGYLLYSHQASTDILRIAAIVHNFLGAAMVAMFITHLYMSLVAIKGSLGSMINGYKSEEELKILHPRFKF